MLSLVILASQIHSGGVATESRKCLQYLENCGKDSVQIWCTDQISGDTDASRYFNFKSSGVHRSLWLVKLFYNIFNFFVISIAFKKESVKTVVAMHFFPILIANLYNAVSFRKIKVISVYHTDVYGYYNDANIIKKMFIKLIIFLSNQGSSVVFISQVSLKKCREKFTLKNPIYIPNGVKFKNTYNYKRNPVSEHNNFEMLLVGSLVTTKRIDSALRILKRLASQNTNYNFRLKIAGVGPDDGALKNFAKKLEIRDKVEFLGYVSNLEKYYREVDLLISTSEREGMPLNILESISYGTPVVVMDCETGPREIMGIDKRISSRDSEQSIITKVGVLCVTQSQKYRLNEGCDSAEVIFSNAILDILSNGINFDNRDVAKVYTYESISKLWEEITFEKFNV